ncbi:DUF459 domain-containing protein [Roseiarcaceae bacterium H3SJ34-1]|uniref:SGNH/GDSL hydrolase family protein n=1 Tax=Terripilifer ovatus TaxID=3032367 RepID=UPI003AB96822|nr:DUF459 domain-containing protein [Roseiarcaceae bacterium H3SJ34-1]
MPTSPNSIVPPPASRPARRWRIVKLGLVGAFLFLTGGPAVIAQYDDSNSSLYWQRERQRMQGMQPQFRRPPIVVQRPTQLIRRAAPRRGFAREVPHELQPHTNPALGSETPQNADAMGAPNGATPPPAAATPAPAPAPAVAATQAPRPIAANTVIAVIGDNIGQLLAQGLQDAFAERPEISVLRKVKENSGLVRDDYYDWNKATRELLAGNEKITLAIMMIGSNDRQQMRDGSTMLDPRTPKWNAAYAARVEAIATQFRDRKIPLIWVGMPVMKNERLSAELVAFNEIYRDVAAKTGATYVDVWEAFVDDRNQFSIFGPDLNGQIVRLRTGDGVHFTRAGARKLAYFVEGDIRRILDAQSPAAQPAIANAPAAAPGAQPQATVRVELPPEIPQTYSQGGLPLPLPPQAPLIAIPVRPAAGPVLSLTSPATSPGGQLATRARNARADSNELTQRALVMGAPLDARPGRADDFSWPRAN